MTDIYCRMNHPNGFVHLCENPDFRVEISVQYQNNVDGGELVDTLFRAYEAVIEELKKELGNEIPKVRDDKE